MAEMHLHLTGPAADHPEWTVESDDDFDAQALEQAMIRSRQEAYAALRESDAA